METKHKFKVGQICVQQTCNTIFKYEILFLEEKSFRNKNYYIVKNIETGFTQLISENELKAN